LADEALISTLNDRISKGELKNKSGQPVKEKLDGGLLRTDRKILYPIREDIPVMLIEEAGRRLKDAGITNAIVINHQQGQLTLETRVEGVRNGLGGDVKAIAVDGSDPVQIRNGAASALRQNPDVQALMTLGPGAAEQTLKAIKDSGRAGDVKLATFDISAAVLEAVKAGEILFAIDQQMFLQTYLAILSLVTYAQYRLRPVTAVPSGPLFVDQESAQDIIELSAEGIH
jgi:simple sugar transport system substrate-binding protein